MKAELHLQLPPTISERERGVLAGDRVRSTRAARWARGETKLTLMSTNVRWAHGSRGCGAPGLPKVARSLRALLSWAISKGLVIPWEPPLTSPPHPVTPGTRNKVETCIWSEAFLGVPRLGTGYVALGRPLAERVSILN